MATTPDKSKSNPPQTAKPAPGQKPAGPPPGPRPTTPPPAKPAQPAKPGQK